MFYEISFEGKTYLKSDFFDGLVFTTRNSAIKLDNESLELENRLALQKIFGCKNFVAPIQTHSANIGIASVNSAVLPDTDAVILTIPNVIVTLNFADCTPIILYDREKNIVAGIHAGWRGTAQEIATKTAKKMVEKFGCTPRNIMAVIGTCISYESFEVSREVIDAIIPTVVSPEKVYHKKENEKYMLDLKEVNRQQLAKIGIENFDISPYCTILNNDKFFSYRKEKTSCRHNFALCLN